MKNILFITLLIGMVCIVAILHPQATRSAPPTSVRDTLSSSQLSYFARIGTGVSTGDSVIRVALSGNPTNDTNNLFVGDTVGIGTTAAAGLGQTGPLTLYIVKDIGNTALFQIDTGIGSSNTFVGAAIVATHSAIHTITFTPQSNFTGGFWEFLIKASDTSGETINDGIPDTNGFDLGATTPSSTANGVGTRLKQSDVTCPNWGTGTTTAYSIGSTTIPIGVGSSGLYHIITCYLGIGGTNAVGTTNYAVTIGKDLSTGSQLINPSPKDTNEGSADVYTFYIRHRNDVSTLFDSDTIQGKIAVIEAVRVSATIDPTLTFTIDAVGMGSGSTECNVGTTAITFASNADNTTATQVAFGSLSLQAANDLGQRLTASTNANNGYVVTVYEDGNMHSIGTTSAAGIAITIPDTNCGGNSSGCTPSGVGNTWLSFSNSGWGYLVKNVNVGTTYTSSPLHRPFGNGYTNASAIMSKSSTPLTSEQAYICYRLVASSTQQAGNYENRLIYTATSTF